MHAGELELARIEEWSTDVTGDGGRFGSVPWSVHTRVLCMGWSLPVTVIRPWQLLYSIGTYPTAL